jgi:hypothetical protein
VVLLWCHRGTALCDGLGAGQPEAPQGLWCDSVTDMVLQWCYSGVTVVLQWCYSGVTVVLQWCYSGVTVVLQWSRPPRSAAGPVISRITSGSGVTDMVLQGVTVCESECLSRESNGHGVIE